MASRHGYINLALTNATRYGYYDIANYLINHGANNFNQALIGAVKYGNHLINLGADRLNTALITAARGGHQNII